MNDLFGSTTTGRTPQTLAEVLRPTRIEDVVGQDHLTSPVGPVSRMMATGPLRSMVLWGPPGSGKTTMATLLARSFGRRVRTLHGSTTGAAELKALHAEAAMNEAGGASTCLVVEEIHRLGRTQQEQLLRPIDTGAVVLIGCTTEHVAYDLVDGLLSRVLVLRPKALDAASLSILVERAERHHRRSLPVTKAAREAIVTACAGDGRRLLGIVESLMDLPTGTVVDMDGLEAVCGTTPWRSDRDRDLHYDRMSAMQKAVRASDPDAALYWFAQMIEAGEDMDFVVRRLILLANEEVGLADPMALVHATAAADAYARLGHKGGVRVLAQAVVHMATSPKSNAVHRALDRARALVRSTGDKDPGVISINHPNRAIASERGYVDDHDRADAFGGQDHWPEGLARRPLYEPTPRGAEAAIGRRMDTWIRSRG